MNEERKILKARKRGIWPK